MVVVIGHRGASGYRPEHTLAGYELAARLGADYLEPDLVVTADGELVCRHEPELSGTTDVAAHRRFADRRRTTEIDGTEVSGWFVHDFTLDELRTLRVKERLPHLRPGNTTYDGRFAIPTFEELLQLRVSLSVELDREIGVYPETKHPSLFRELGLPQEQRLVDLLETYGLNAAQAPVCVQSFEPGSLRRLRELGLLATGVQLLSSAGAPWEVEVAGGRHGYPEMVTPAGLREISTYAQAIGPAKGQLLRRSSIGLGASTGLVGAAHDAGLLVHAYTFRAENTFLPVGLRRGEDPAGEGDALGELLAYLRIGVDGVFADHPDLALRAVALLQLERSAAV
ncbi:glycerophosphodiester phosphodiesterase family protein [Spongisporangium articulatum]|uniref:glycerophosphodiester phosphodiesterase n=1 Tax=Spongisporangium articulatum TaxID=3362603 RepID=A0ABW8APD6_9ACTN